MRLIISNLDDTAGAAGFNNVVLTYLSKEFLLMINEPVLIWCFSTLTTHSTFFYAFCQTLTHWWTQRGVSPRYLMDTRGWNHQVKHHLLCHLSHSHPMRNWETIFPGSRLGKVGWSFWEWPKSRADKEKGENGKWALHESLTMYQGPAGGSGHLSTRGCNHRGKGGGGWEQDDMMEMSVSCVIRAIVGLNIAPVRTWVVVTLHGWTKAGKGCKRDV